MNWRNIKLLKLGTKPVRCRGGAVLSPQNWLTWARGWVGAHISHSMWHSHCHFQRKGQAGASSPYTDLLRGRFHFFFLKHVFLLTKVSFSYLGGKTQLYSPSSTTSLALCKELCRKCWFQDIPGSGNKVCSWEKLLNTLNIPGVLVSWGSVWVCMGKTLYSLGGNSTEKCSWYYFPVEKAAEREAQGWDCSVLCLLGWGAVITHISEFSYRAISMDPRCSTWTDQSWSRSSESSSLIFGNKLLTYSSRWKHSTCISFSPCWLQAPFSNYIPLCFSTSQFSCCLHSARNNIFL